MKLELLQNLVVSDLMLKYKGTFLGFLWAVIKPIFIISTLLFVFTRLFQPDIENYPGFLITGFVAWNFFSSGTKVMDSLVSKKNLLLNLNLPQEYIILSACLVALIGSVFEFLFLVLILALLGVDIGVYSIFIVPIFLLEFVFIYGVALLLSAYYVKFRDLNNIWEVFSEMMFFATPIIYPNSLLMPDFAWLLMINPMAHFITNFRKVLFLNQAPTASSLIILLTISLSSYVLGLFVFNLKKPSFAEDV